MSKSLDGNAESSAKNNTKSASNMMNEIINQRLTTLPNMPARPGDPHYVGQSIYDAETGMLDLNSGKFTQGEDSIKRSIADLGTESKLISGAQAGGKTAAQDILSGNASSAESALKTQIADLKGNYFNGADRTDFQKALADLQKGSKWQAEAQIAKAEETLNNRGERVKDASGSLKEGLTDFNSGKFHQGEQDMKNAMADLRKPAKLSVPPNDSKPPHLSVPPNDSVPPHLSVPPNESTLPHLSVPPENPATPQLSVPPQAGSNG